MNSNGPQSGARPPSHALPVPDPLPDGYVLARTARAVLALRAEYAEPLARIGFGPESDGTLVASDLRGRRGMWELELPNERLVVRRFSHGGLARWLTGTRFRDGARPFRELELSERLRLAGLRTPLIVAARARRAPLFGWRLAVVSRRVPGSLDLGHLLGAARRGELARPQLRRLLRGVGQWIARLHALGFVHADLNPNNLLVELDSLEAKQPRLWLLDLDRSVFELPLADERRRENLRRLYRHVAQREERYGASLSRADYLRFLRSYTIGARRRSAAMGRAGAARWKADWRAIVVAHERANAAHRLGWFLERALGRSRDERHA